VLSTFVSYKLISSDIGKALDRVEKTKTVDRATDYYLENIVNVKSIDEFLDDDRLYRFAMKAHGLEDMIYAKAFIRKALEGGIADSDSFANKLTDKRYAEFVQTYNFAALGEAATTYNKAQVEIPKGYFLQAEAAGLDPTKDKLVQQETRYFQANITKIKSIDELMKNERLLTYAMAAFGLDSQTEDLDHIRELLEGGTRDPDAPVHDEADAYIAFVASLDFEGLGEQATTYNRAQQPAMDKYLRQTLEETAGETNEGVRLALYFERKAPNLTSFYQVLSDPALAQVVRTALALPAEFANADIDRQVKLFEQKLDIEDFKDPEKLQKFMQRFTALWDVTNGPQIPQSPALTILSQPAQFGLSNDLLTTIQSMKKF
jgi:hypothetical protein